MARLSYISLFEVGALTGVQFDLRFRWHLLLMVLSIKPHKNVLQVRPLVRVAQGLESDASLWGEVAAREHSLYLSPKCAHRGTVLLRQRRAYRERLMKCGDRLWAYF